MVSCCRSLGFCVRRCNGVSGRVCSCARCHDSRQLINLREKSARTPQEPCATAAWALPAAMRVVKTTEANMMSFFFLPVVLLNLRNLSEDDCKAQRLYPVLPGGSYVYSAGGTAREKCPIPLPRKRN